MLCRYINGTDTPNTQQYNNRHKKTKTVLHISFFFLIHKTEIIPKKLNYNSKSGFSCSNQKTAKNRY